MLKAGLLRRDELAARLVHAVREEHAVTMPQFRQALEHGIDSVPDAPAALRDFFAAVEDRPDWVDDDLLEQGARASRRIGPDGQDILAYGSLLGGYRTAAGLEPLVRSGRLAGKDALRRVGETGAWWLGCTSPGGMEQVRRGLAALGPRPGDARVREPPARARRRLGLGPARRPDQRGRPGRDHRHVQHQLPAARPAARHPGQPLRRPGDHAPLVLRRLADGRRAAVAAAHRAGRPAGALPVRVDRPGPGRERPGARGRADGDDRPPRRGGGSRWPAGGASGR